MSHGILATAFCIWSIFRITKLVYQTCLLFNTLEISSDSFPWSKLQECDRSSTNDPIPHLFQGPTRLHWRQIFPRKMDMLRYTQSFPLHATITYKPPSTKIQGLHCEKSPRHYKNSNNQQPTQTHVSKSKLSRALSEWEKLREPSLLKNLFQLSFVIKTHWLASNIPY